MSGRRKIAGGYILVEAVVSMALLGVGAFAVHGTIQDAIRTRGQSQDYTRARFLLEELVGDLELQPELEERSESGRFSDENSRFRWQYEIRRVDVPKPGAPLRPRPKGGKKTRFKYLRGYGYLGHVRAVVMWERGGLSFEESFETLIGPDQLWQPPEVKR